LIEAFMSAGDPHYKPDRLGMHPAILALIIIGFIVVIVVITLAMGL